ncbi:MAG TPA: amidohydrolase family protein, partial [Vicinamibacterales bacterium]|nr:amidohydrolase family protein [Vicinamibacterales bacterium]
MAGSTRRSFLGQLGAAAVLPAVGLAGRAAAQGAAAQTTAAQATATFDLLIRGGRVIDPSQQLSAVRDVAIAGGRIARIAENIPAAQARQVYDASGKIVTPGLIDMHTHVYQYAINLSVDSDIVGFQNGVTTVLDCGSTGSGSFAGLRRYVMESARTRIYALLNISSIGLIVTNEIYLDPNMINAAAAIRTINNNRDRLLGVKVRIMGRKSDLAHDIEVLKVAREVADTTGTRIMLHWTTEPDLLNILKRGDILAHPFNPPSNNSSNLFGADGQQSDKVLPQILALKERGIITDGQLATTHHSWTVSEKAAAQGWWPDTISTDISRTPDGQPASVLVPMSEFLHLGMPIEQVIAGVTSTPARTMGAPEKIGTLEPGTTADVAVLELEQGSFEYN